MNVMEDNIYKHFGYFTYDDIMKVTNNEELNILAINGPNGTTIELPDSQCVEKLYKQTLNVFIKI